MARVKVVWTSDASQLLKDTEKVIDAGKRTEKQTDKTAKETRELDRLTKKLLRENETALEKYNRRLNETAVLYNKQRIGVEDVKRATKRYNDELKESERGQKGAFGAAALSRLASFALAYVGLSRVATEFRKELEATQRLSDRAAALKAGIVPARNLFARNLTDATIRQTQESIARVEAFSETTGASRADLVSGAARGLSAAGGRISELARVEESTLLAFQLTPLEPGAGGPLTESFVDIGRKAGITPRQAAGATLRFQAQSRVVGLAQAARNQNVLAALIQEGKVTLATGLAFLSAGTQGAGDDRGEQVSTLLPKFVTQLETIFREEGIVLTPEQKEAPLNSMIEILQGNPDLATAVLNDKRLTGETKPMELFVRSLLTKPEGAKAQEFRRNRAELALPLLDPALEAVLERQTAVGGAALTQARGEARLGRVVSGQLLGRRAELSVGAQLNIRQALVLSGMTDFEARARMLTARVPFVSPGGMAFTFGEGEFLLQERLDELERGPAVGGLGGGLRAEPSKADQIRADNLQDAIDAMRDTQQSAQNAAPVEKEGE